ncbi:hypothetical protein KAW80_04015 [Candidatus Babeliales bacterium]|nr:hypothetical protein [Candidatus Babeliales bacterium]
MNKVKKLLLSGLMVFSLGNTVNKSYVYGGDFEKLVRNPQSFSDYATNGPYVEWFEDVLKYLNKNSDLIELDKDVLKRCKRVHFQGFVMGSICYEARLTEKGLKGLNGLLSCLNQIVVDSLKDCEFGDLQRRQIMNLSDARTNMICLFTRLSLMERRLEQKRFEKRERRDRRSLLDRLVRRSGDPEFTSLLGGRDEEEL